MQNVLVDDRRIWVDLCVSWLALFLIVGNDSMYSSQSVAKTNQVWSNDIKRGPRIGKGAIGFGGRDDLVQTKRYRDSFDERDRGGYGMVFDVPANDRPRKRSRSREGRDFARDSRRRRSRSVSPKRDKADRRRDGDVDRK